jgi:hypothetical protein
VQWLCNADRSSHEPRKRLKAFFESLYRCLARGARAVLQVGTAATNKSVTTCLQLHSSCRRHTRRDAGNAAAAALLISCSRLMA